MLLFSNQKGISTYYQCPLGTCLIMAVIQELSTFRGCQHTLQTLCKPGYTSSSSVSQPQGPPWGPYSEDICVFVVRPCQLLPIMINFLHLKREKCKTIKVSSTVVWEACLHSYLCLLNLHVTKIYFNNKCYLTHLISWFAMVDSTYFMTVVHVIMFIIMLMSNKRASRSNPRVAFQMKNSVGRRKHHLTTDT